MTSQCWREIFIPLLWQAQKKKWFRKSSLRLGKLGKNYRKQLNPSWRCKVSKFEFFAILLHYFRAFSKLRSFYLQDRLSFFNTFFFAFHFILSQQVLSESSTNEIFQQYFALYCPQYTDSRKKPEVARKRGLIALELSKWRTKCWGRTKKFECM